MKLRLIYIIAFSIFATYVLQSKRLGLASQNSMDRTGSPLSNGLNCNSCHTGGLNGVSLSLRVKDSGGNIVTSYRPGDTYTVEFDLASTSGFTRGFQGVALTGSNAQAGTFFSPQTNTQISTIGNRQYVEHSSPALSAGTFVFIASWTAPTIGTGNVTIYSDGVVANGNNGTSGDDPAGPVTLVLTEEASASIDYVQATYCQGSSDPTPTITGTAGGTFSVTPAGLTLNSTSGEIDLSVSTPGSYTITYTSATGTTTDAVTIIATDDASFSYNKSSYCLNESDPTPIVTGLAGGIFVRSPAGIVINSTTGQIDVSASAIGTYSVGYITNGPCPVVETVMITIGTVSDPSFAYGNSTYCQNGTDPIPVSVSSGGTYSSSTGLSINANSGLINLSASSPGTYNVTYTTGGACSSSSVQSVTINAASNTSFVYNRSSYCQNESDPIPTVIGLGGGVFSSIGGLSINSNTGQIDLSASAPGTHIVTYTTSGACPISASQSIIINEVDDASFNYGIASYCQSANDPSPIITGLGGGVFSSTAGLSISANTGQIDVSASSVGTYVITYTTSGTCPSSAVASISIVASDNATFLYGNASYCQDGNDPSPTIMGSNAGLFSSAAGLSINSNTGQIDVSASTVGTYSVTYTTNGPCPNSNTVSVLITAADNATFAYNANSVCQNGSDLVATVTGLSGGTFSSTTGLALNASSGLIDVSASTAGTYHVTYRTNGPCPNVSLVTVTIMAADDALFTYGGTTFCQNATDPIPTANLSGGTYTALPTGLALNAATGVIDVSGSTVGTYAITYTTNGACSDASTLSIAITATGDASFNYNAIDLCQNGLNPSPNITGNPGGTFTSTTGLVLNGTTGEINLVASTLGTYTVTYTTTGACPSSSSTVINLLAGDVAAFGYTDTTICLNIGVNPILSAGAANTGVYTVNSSNLVFANTATGEIDLGASVAGNYVITYTSNGNCPAIETVNIDLSICGAVQSLRAEEVYTLFPNPNDGRFSIENKGSAGDLMIRVRDLYGKVIYLQEAYLENQEQYTIEVPGIVGGMYLIEIQKEGTVKVLQMIVSE